MTTPYRKPHLSVEQQVALLRSRGLVIADDEAAARLLGAIGYYRLSAYVYPYRELLSPDAPRESATHFRSDTIARGTTFEQVAALHAFDRELRGLCQGATGVVEVGLRTRVADVLGRRDPFGHVHAAALDPGSCAGKTKEGPSRFNAWRRRSDQLLRQSRNEDFIAHFRDKYAAPLPVWVAAETWDFGALARLMGLLRTADAIAVARGVGVENGKLLVHVAEGLNLVRNISAHHGRLWNRSLTHQLRVYRPDDVAGAPAGCAAGGDRAKLYCWLVWLGHLADAFDPEAGWPGRLDAHVATLAPATGLTPEQHMGYPPLGGR